MLEMQLLGGFQVAHQGEQVAGLHSRRQQSLLSYLVLHRQTPQPRQHVAFLFWPESSEAQARSNLRRELTHLRQRVPEGDRYLRIERDWIQWRPEAAFALDIRDFEDEVRQAEEATNRSAARKFWERALSRYYGDLLPGCYDEWILPERERLRQAYALALERLVRHFEDEREYAPAIGYSRRLLQLDPLQEAGYRKLMQLYASNGERAGAVHVYHSCARVLERELGIEPSQETQMLYRKLLEPERPAAPADGVNGHSRRAERPASPPSESPAATPGGNVAPLVGREVELDRLVAAWRRASDGNGQMVAILGEAGIGKTRLAEELLDRAGQYGTAAVRTRCYAAGGRLPFAPVADLLKQDACSRALLRLDDVWLTEVSRLVPELLVERTDLRSPEPLREAWQRSRLFEALARAVLATGQPLLVLIDDLQWSDVDTLEWLHYLLRYDSNSKLLVVCTLRSEEYRDNGELKALLWDLGKLDQLVDVELGPLSSAETAELASGIVVRKLEEEETARLFEETEGQPLFVVERARAGLSLQRQAAGGDWAPAPGVAGALPAKVQAVIAARLAQLSPAARELVQLAATIGRAFSFEVLDEASALGEEALVHALDELWQRRIVREQGAESYDFSHDRIRDVAYLEVSPVRRRALHRRVAQALELLHRSDLDGVSARVAAHYEHAGQTERAIAFYRRAAVVARQVYANEEAIRLYSRALDLLKHLPDNRERDKQELDLQLALSSPLNAARGYTSPDLEATLDRGLLLGEELQEDDKVIQSLWGLWTVHFVRASLPRSRELAEQMSALAQRSTTLLAESHHALGGSLTSLGELSLAKDHLERVLAHCESRDQHSRTTILGSDLCVFSHSWMSHNLWLVGSVDQAAEHSRRAILLANELDHPYSLALANAYASIQAQLRRDPEACRLSAERTLALCRKHGFAYYGEWGLILQGWVLCQEGAAEQAITSIEQGLENLRAAGAETRRPYYMSLLADAHRRAGRHDDARKVLDEALATAERNHDLWWSAELYRLSGELSEPRSAAPFQQALEVARRQGSRSLELRAAVSLAGVWRQQSQRAEARRLVQQVLGQLTEGFDTPDLREARMLLEELS